MKTGISTASLYSVQETENAVNTIKSLRAACTEVFLQTFYEYRPEFAKSIAPAICGLDVHSLHVLPVNFEPQLFYDTRRSRGDGYYWLDQVMRSAQLLGCKNYTFHGFVRREEGNDFDIIAERLREAVNFCAHYGVQLCLENVQWSLYNRPGIFKELKSRIPELAGVFDIKQARRSGYPYSMYLKDMSGAISHVHLSDIDENGAICPPGKGIYDFEDIIKRLKDAGFDGAVLIETSPCADIAALKQSLEFIDEIIYKIK